MTRDRGQGLISVVFWLLAALFALWIFFLLVGDVLEPIRAIVTDSEAVQQRGHADALENFWSILTLWSPLLFGGGAIILFVAFSVFREQFSSGRAPRP